MTDRNLPVETKSSRVYAGDYWRYDELHFKDGANGSMFDLTSAWSDWRAQFRPAAGSATVIDLDVDDSNAASGVLIISCEGDRTQMMGGDGVWDLQALDGAGKPITFIRSKITWIQDVTRP